MPRGYRCLHLPATRPIQGLVQVFGQGLREDHSIDSSSDWRRVLRRKAMNPLISWLGAGGVPVDRKLADQRAAVCELCPLNGHPHWWDTAVGSVADTIRQILQLKAHRSISVPNEDKLFMCSACGCCVRLKVHAPLEHIRQGLRFADTEKLDPRCWILKEINQ